MTIDPTAPADPSGPSDPTPPGDLSAQIAALLAQAREQGVDVSELLGTPVGFTLAEQIALRLPTLLRDHKGTYGTWAGYLNRLASGLRERCACACLLCAQGSCPCGDGRHVDACSPEQNISCTDRMPGHGDDDVRTITRHHLTDAAWWARRHALQRTTVRNANREAEGRVQHNHDGRGAQESMIQAQRWLWEEMRRDKVVADNQAKDVEMPSRQEPIARSLEVGDFLTLHSLAISTGDDPALDGLILRHMLIQATRRSGVLSLLCKGVNRDQCQITYWDQKRDTNRTRPSTPEHLDALLGHAMERGARVAAPRDAPAAVRRTGVVALTPNDPVFYYRPVDTFDSDGNFLSRKTRPLTRKRFEVLFTRMRRHHPSFDARGLRPHDIRHTSGRLVYEAGGEAAAKLQLAHDGGTSSELYYKEHMDSLAALKRELFSPPSAEPTPGVTG